jgi:hypothetical protein
LPEQFVMPEMQEHVAEMQVSFNAVSHLVPQVPQLLLSDFVSTHAPPQPSADGLQNVTMHMDPHLPFTHTKPAQHLLPQAPQLAGSLLRLTHFPPHDV